MSVRLSIRIIRLLLFQTIVPQNGYSFPACVLVTSIAAIPDTTMFTSYVLITSTAADT
jgi:hypothetical protein